MELPSWRWRASAFRPFGGNSWIGVENSKSVLEQVSVRHLVQELEAQGQYSLYIKGVSSKRACGFVYKHLQYGWLNDAKRKIVIAQTDATELFLEQQEKMKVLERESKRTKDILESISTGICELMMPDADHLIVNYANTTMFLRIRNSEYTSLGDGEGLAIPLQFRRTYYIDFQLSVHLREKLIVNDKLDFYLVGDSDKYTMMISHPALKRLVAKLVKRPFRCKPFYSEGVWGGYFILNSRNLPRDQFKNIAWSVDMNGMDNSLMIQLDDKHRLELPFLAVLEEQPAAIMQSGIVDGMETVTEALVTQSFYKLGKYILLTRHIFSCNAPVINEKLWQSLSENDRKLMQKCMDETTAELRKEVIGKESEYLGKLKTSGNEVITLADQDKLVDLFKPYWNEYAQKHNCADFMTSPFTFCRMSFTALPNAVSKQMNASLSLA